MKDLDQVPAQTLTHDFPEWFSEEGPLSLSLTEKFSGDLEESQKAEAMAGHDDSGSSEKSPNGLPTFNAENMQSNMKAIYYCRTFMSIIGGVIAGILGFTGFTGFVFYFLVMAITSVGLIAKAGFTIHSYFDSWNQIIFDGILGGLMSFVLFWTFAYDIVHIF